MEPRQPGAGPRELALSRALVTRSTGQLPAGREPRRARLLAAGLLATALAAAVVLLVGGEALPWVWPVVVLVGVLAIESGRGALFTTELVATGEAAVMFCAIVGLRTVSPLLGPMCVAFAFGVVELHHWRERAWTRMAFNAGYQALAVLAATLVFQACTAALGSSALALVAAAVVAVIPYVAVGAACGAVLMRTLGESSWAAAARHQWDLHQLVLPLAVAGAVVGLIADRDGWWLAVLLVPAVTLPEIVYGRAWRRRWPTRVQARVVAIAAAALATAVAVIASPTSRLLPCVVGIAGAIALGAESRVHAPRAVPPLAIVAVVTVALVAAGHEMLFGAVVAVVVTACSWAWARAATLGSVVSSIGSAAVVGLAVGALVAAVAPTAGAGTLVLAALSGAAVGAGLAAAASQDTRKQAAAALWSAPILVGSVVLAVAWAAPRRGPGLARSPWGGLAWAVGVGATLVLVALVAAPPWGSRRLGPRLGRRAPPSVRVLVIVLVALTSAAASGALVAAGTTRVVTTLGAVTCAEAMAAVAMALARQWRFAPAPRRRTATAMVTVALVAALCFAPLARGNVLASLVLVGCTVGAAIPAWRVAPVVARSAQVAR